MSYTTIQTARALMPNGKYFTSFYVVTPAVTSITGESYTPPPPAAGTEPFTQATVIAFNTRAFVEFFSQ